MPHSALHVTRIAQVSDIHFGSEADGATEMLLRALNASRFDLIIMSGDLTMAARRREFHKARTFIDALDAPTLCVPGNHDITPYHLIERFSAPFARWKRFISAVVEPSWDNGRVAVVGLNTARRMRLRLDWSHGSISRGQIARLPGRFAAMPQTPFRIVVAHHPFLAQDGPVNDKRPRVMVKRAERALSAFAKARVDLVLAGHLHRTYAASYDGGDPPRAAVLAQTGVQHRDNHRVMTIQAGTALSARTRGEPNSFNRIDVIGERMEVRAVKLTPSGWQADETPLATVERPDVAQ
ncbi:MAG: metallophosphoesterase [Pseudomonadota bacterium]